MPTPTYHNVGSNNYGDWQAVTLDGEDVTLTPGPCRAVYVGGAGSLEVTSAAGNAVTFTGLAAGTVLPVQASVINAAGTTATGVVALY